MNIVLFYHSIISDWNNGHAHFLRGIATELKKRGHEVQVYEPRDAWSVAELLDKKGDDPIQDFYDAYPLLGTERYDLNALDLDEVLHDADLVIAHEWNDHALIERLNEHRRTNHHYRLLFHDTHHRASTVPYQIEAYEISHFDGVLAFGRIIRDLYLENGWTENAWIWHEAADTNVFFPRDAAKKGDVVWIGNWGDEERSEELREFFIEPVRDLGISARAYGVRYPEEARHELDDAGIEYAGWLPNFRVPDVFAQFRITLHIPRRPYTEALPGIPTIRPFEALACGIPLVCSPWEDTENLFTPGQDFLMARDGTEMKEHLSLLLSESERADKLARYGRQTLLNRHTCAHRVDQLMSICEEMGLSVDTLVTQ